MLTEQIIVESAVAELVSKIPKLTNRSANSITRLIRKVSSRHKITTKALHDLFRKKHGQDPHSWAKAKHRLSESSEGRQTSEVNWNDDPLVQEFIQWAAEQLGLEHIPEVEFSYDTEEAQANHHTGSHVVGSSKVWVYVANRSMVDFLRTLIHEMVHVRQGELGLIKPNSGYPGSPIEMEADALAGKFMKIFGKDHPEIFQ